MSLQTVVPIGAQVPRVACVPRAVANDVEDATFLAGSYGLVADQWQESVLEGWLGIRADGMWAAPRCGLAVPRQNGKNAALEIRELHGMVSLGERILHSAHEVKTARKAFLRLASFFENERTYPELAKLAKEIRRTNGQEAIVLHNGGSVEFIARSKGSGRGFSVDVLVMDEAQEFSDESLAALLPTISASANPQQIMTGTPPGPTANGGVFTRLREEGVGGGNRRLCWHEWSCVGEVDLDDRQVWAATNPGLGIRLKYETTQDERSAMDAEMFARERLGMWDTAATKAVINMDTWAALTDVQSQALDPVAFALDVSPDRSSAAIASAGVRADGLSHVVVVDTKAGTGWVVDRLVELNGRWKPCAVVVDSRGPAASMIPALEARGVVVTTTTTAEVGRACGAFYDAVMQGDLRHLGQASLSSALSGARKRTLGDAWAWHRQNSSTDITPLVAATLALFGYATRPPPAVTNTSTVMYGFN